MPSKTSHGFGTHEYAAGSRLIGKWLEETYPDAKIESRYSLNRPTDPDTFFKDADTVIFDGVTGLHYHWNWEEDSFRKTVLDGVAWSARLEVPENGIETAKPTREFLESVQIAGCPPQIARPFAPSCSHEGGREEFKPLIHSHL